jgi:hypothetical protein
MAVVSPILDIGDKLRDTLIQTFASISNPKSKSPICRSAMAAFDFHMLTVCIFLRTGDM